MRIVAKQLIIAIVYVALSVSLIGFVIAAGAAVAPETWGEPGSRAAVAGALLAKKIFAPR